MSSNPGRDGGGALPRKIPQCCIFQIHYEQMYTVCQFESYWDVCAHRRWYNPTTPLHFVSGLILWIIYSVLFSPNLMLYVKKPINPCHIIVVNLDHSIEAYIGVHGSNLKDLNNFSLVEKPDSLHLPEHYWASDIYLVFSCVILSRQRVLMESFPVTSKYRVNSLDKNVLWNAKQEKICYVQMQMFYET